MNVKLVFCYAALLVTLASCNLPKRLAKAEAHFNKHQPYDAIIVPGYPYVTPQHPYGTERDRVLINVRLHYAVELYKQGKARNIIFSGAAVHTPFVEGTVMKIMADSLGVPADKIFVEDRALHSNQNATRGRKLARTLGLKKIILATDPYQFSYLQPLAAIFTPGLRVVAFPMDKMVDYIKPLPSIDSSSAYVPDFTPIN